jgi:hypothetical protein
MNTNLIRQKLLLIVAVCLNTALYAHPADPLYNVKNYGARGDGKAIDGEAINKTIQAAAAAPFISRPATISPIRYVFKIISLYTSIRAPPS